MGNTLDLVSWVGSAIDSLVNSGSALFLSTGNQLLTSIGIIMLAVYGLKWAAASASRHHGEFDFPGLIHFFAVFLIAEACLRYYAVPLPWTSSSVSTIFPDTGRQFSSMIDLTILNDLLGKIKAITDGTEQPSFWDPMKVATYFFVLIDMALVEATLFVVNILAFIAIGLGQLVGPLFIPWLIVPQLKFLFWNWTQFMLQYSFYRVLASGLTFIWSGVLVKFIDHSIHGDYTLAHFVTLLVPLLVLNVGLAVSVFKVSGFISDLFRGSSGTGGDMGRTISSAIKGAFL